MTDASQAARAAARDTLDAALASLALEAAGARKAARRIRTDRDVPTTDLLSPVVEAYRAVLAAEEALDIAQRDAVTARGQEP